MKIQIQKIVRPLDLGEYAHELKGQVVQVWINPDRITSRGRELLVEEYNRRLGALNKSPELLEKIKASEDRQKELQQEIESFNTWAMGDFINGIHQWFADLWSQGADKESQWIAAELVELNEKEPALYGWMKNQSMQMIEDHRNREKKG